MCFNFTSKQKFAFYFKIKRTIQNKLCIKNILFLLMNVDYQGEKKKSINWNSSEIDSHLATNVLNMQKSVGLSPKKNPLK
jgi:hypothetical protein